MLCNCRVASLLTAFVVAAATSGATAATATSGVTIFRVQLPTLDFPGTGSSSFNFASGTYTQGSSTATGSASAGQGSITAFAAAGDFGGSANSLGSMATNAHASLTDSFHITADTDQPLRFDFGLRASGNVNTVRSGNNAGTSSASVEWSVSMSGGPSTVSASGSVSEAYVPEVVDGILIRRLVRTETGLSFSEFALVAEVGNGQVGQTFSLSMSALARAGFSRGPAGTSASGTADFGNTLRWLGLRSVTFADGTPYTGALSITSESGFDYTTPTPGAAGLLMAAAGFIGSRRRR